MRRFLLGCLVGSLVISVIVAVPQLSKQRETIRLGSTDLNLGMAEDAAVKQLAESGYVPRKMNPPQALRDKGITSMWAVDEKGDKPSIGVITFASGKLESAMKFLYQEGDEVEFGRRLYFAMRDLELEGNSTCTIETDSGEVPDYSSKTGKLRCGKKTILIELQKFQKNRESVQLNEELDAR
jgi:hypothetical protein